MLNLPVSHKNDVMVMSSVDLAELCVGKGKDDHSNFMKKAKKVLGGDIVNFYDREKYNGGRSERTILLLPEREAFMMAASYNNFSLAHQIAHNVQLEDVVVTKTRMEYDFQEVVYNLFSDYTVIRQFSIMGGKYRIDWYVPELRIAIEFDEPHHTSAKNSAADYARQSEIESHLGCRFIRYTVNGNEVI